ncbi:hypothetical protein AADZ90_022105 [Aestuariibius sp. 2305UL40-4]|uniref:hypothetical protein n=1 Tax=Aestuariibius violaceus TaxID=3234132 RepID=UPI00345EF706
MPQDLAPPPSAATLAGAANGPLSERPREYYTDMPCAEGQGCGGEGVVLPFDQGNVALDEMFGFTDVEELPLSDEVLPVIFDGALLTEEGLLDCFARHYPERAGFLLQLLSDDGDLALGYRFEFIDAPSFIGQASSRLSEIDAEIAQLQPVYDAYVERNTNYHLYGGDRPTEEDNRPGAEAMERLGQLSEERRTLYSRQNAAESGNWEIDDREKVVRVYSIISRNVDRMFLAEHMPFGDDGINPLPTNKQGADWLYAVMGDWMARNGYPGAGSEEEFFRNWLTRNAAGVALVGLGALEMFGGVTVAIGSGGLAAVGGVALTVVGFDTLTQGAKMLWTPDRHASERGWIGDLVHDTAMHFGGEETAQAFDRGWAVTQIAAGLGAPVVIRYATTRATRVAASGQNIRPIPRGQLDEARLGIAEIKGHRFGRDYTADYTPLPSGRGAILNVQGVGRLRLPPLDSDMRVLLRLKRLTRTALQARFARLTRHQGPGTVNDQASATRLMEKVADHCGVDLWKYVDEVRYGSVRADGFEYPNFSVEGGVRIIRIPSDISQTNKYMQLKTAAHELNHARIYDKFVTRLGPVRGHEEYWGAHRDFGTSLYAREEVIVERAAQMMVRSVFEGKLTGANLRRLTDALNDADNYIADWRALM